MMGLQRMKSGGQIEFGFSCPSMGGLAARRILTISCFVSILFLPWPAHAHTVSPTLAEIDLSRSGSTTLRIVNDGDTILRVEAKLFERKQEDNGDYTEAPTKVLIAFPPLMEIPAHSNRALRLMVSPDAREQATKSYYSLRIIQLGERAPTAPPEGEPEGGTVQARILLTFHIPVYVYPRNPVFSLKMDRAEVDSDRLVTWVENDGTSIVRMKDIRAFIRTGSQWRPAQPDPRPRVQAIVVGKVIPLAWDCPACGGTAVSGVRIEGNAPHWGNFTVEKSW